MLIFLIIAVFFMLAVFAPKGHIYKDDHLDDLKLKLHKYSGLSPEYYSHFSTNMELMEDNLRNTELASYYLYKAIDNAQSLALQATGAYSYVIDDVAIITNEIGVYSEGLILDKALLEGNSFKPRYLNEKIN